jgi:hypothetical protein
MDKLCGKKKNTVGKLTFFDQGDQPVDYKLSPCLVQLHSANQAL